jgi:hypothetical protein
MNDLAKWVENNDKHLAATVAWIRLRLQQLIRQAEDTPDAGIKGNNWFKLTQKASPSTKKPANEEIELARQDMIKLENNNPPPALILLEKSLGLSKFDSHVLALCAAMELNTRIADLCAKAQGYPNKPYPNFNLAFALFDDPDWNALAPNAPLRYWRLLEINQPSAQALTSSAISIDERILNYLKGLNYLDDRLAPLMDPMTSRQDDGALPPSQQWAVDHIIGHLTAANGKERLPYIELLGHDIASKRLIAGKVAHASGLNLYAIDLKTLPSHTGDFETFVRLWQRESMLMPLALYISIDGASEAEKTLLKRFLERCNGTVFLDRLDSKAESVRNRISVEINKPTPQEQQRLWIEALQDHSAYQTEEQPQRLSEQFSFSQDEIKYLAKAALAIDSQNPAALNDLWKTCRIAARAGMEQLATRIDAKAEWDQLVLPQEQKTLLRQITDQVILRNRVYNAWGFREKMNRGLGINALFAGESGTGKTMAAEVIANELQLDLFRIDLSAVVNKYIGETEKNLRKLFDAAEDSGAILFFDEADALFGKRSEVKDSHDRYANIEINYLLQRMESYRGLAILATNMKNSLDKAFMRRLRFIVDFPFPGVEERKDIWKKAFPPDTPVDQALDYQRLAALNLTGGSIQNVALNAAFLAAQENNGRVTMPLILSAARTEFKKLERPAKESDFRWQDVTEAK